MYTYLQTQIVGLLYVEVTLEKRLRSLTFNQRKINEQSNVELTLHSNVYSTLPQTLL